MQAIHGIQPPSKLQAIINDGLKRMDDAVEAAIEKHCPFDIGAYIDEVNKGNKRAFTEAAKLIGNEPVQAYPTCVICHKPNPHEHQDFCVDLGCSGRLDTSKDYVESVNEGLRLMNRAIAPLSDKLQVDLDAQRLYNYRMSQIAEEAALATEPKFTINTDVMVQGNIDPNTGILRYHKELPYKLVPNTLG